MGGQTGRTDACVNVSEEDISDLLQRITKTTYNVDGYFLGESFSGIGI